VTTDIGQDIELSPTITLETGSATEWENRTEAALEVKVSATHDTATTLGSVTIDAGRPARVPLCSRAYLAACRPRSKAYSSTKPQDRQDVEDRSMELVDPSVSRCTFGLLCLASSASAALAMLVFVLLG
jgi:hypothetical protein